MLVNSVNMHIRQENIREGNYYFQDTILKQSWYCFIDSKCTHHNLGTQIKTLFKSVSRAKGNLFVSYENWSRERYIHDFISVWFMFLSHIESIKEKNFFKTWPKDLKSVWITNSISFKFIVWLS